MSLVKAFEHLLAEARPAFPQRRTFEHVRQLAFGFVAAWGRRTISRAICACNAQFDDWSASYRLFSRSPWEPNDLFQPVLKTCLIHTPKEQPFVIALDDTSLKKTSKRIPGVAYGRDPMSPPFNVNLRLGQRYIQASGILRPEGLKGAARAIPIRFHPAPPPAKPGKKATEEALAAYKIAQKTENLSMKAVELIKGIRESVNQAESSRAILLAVDGSYCNSTVLRNLPDNVEVVARARGDLKLFHPPSVDGPEKGRKRKYGAALPKPKDIRTSDDYPWLETPIFGAGRVHSLRHKVVPNVLWRSGTLTKLLRLIIIAPLGYRPTKKSRMLYRDPAYLLTTDLTSPINTLIQAYFDRWEIEVNHRDEKSLLGVGQAQVWSQKAAFRVPQFQVAVYAMLLLASLEAYGPKRTNKYLPLPKWRKQEERRPSTLDIIALLREELLSLVVSKPFLDQETKRTGEGTHASRLISMPSNSKVLGCSIESKNTTPEKSPINLATAMLYAST